MILPELLNVATVLASTHRRYPDALPEVLSGSLLLFDERSISALRRRLLNASPLRCPVAAVMHLDRVPHRSSNQGVVPHHHVSPDRESVSEAVRP